MTEKTKYALKRGTIELVANQRYDRLTIFLNNDRKKFNIKKGEPIIGPMREYQNFELSDDGEITYKYKRMVIDLGNIDGGLKAPWDICRIGVKKLRLMGFRNLMYEDINPYDRRHKRAREEVMKLKRT